MTSIYKQKTLPPSDTFKHYPANTDRRFTREDSTPSSDSVIETPAGKVIAKAGVPICIMTEEGNPSKKWVCKADAFENNFETA